MIQNIDRVSEWFYRLGQGLVRVRWGIVAALVALDALALVGAQRIRSDSSTESWFLENDPLMVATRQFEDIFGNNQFVGVLVETDDVFSADSLRLIRDVGRDLREQVPFADEVVSLTNFDFTRGTADGIDIAPLVPDEIPTDPAALAAIRRRALSRPFLVNRLFSEDGTQAWVSLRLSAYPDDWQSDQHDVPQLAVGETVLDILAQAQYQPYSLKAVGPPVVEYEARRFFAREANSLMLGALLVGAAVLALFLRSLRGIAIPMLTAISSIWWVFGAMGYLGITVDATIVTIPMFLGMAVSIGYSIHIFNFFQRRFTDTGDRQHAVAYAVGETGWPILFTAATTISALLAFYFVPIRQVRWMGLSSAAVVLATYALVMAITPALLSFGPSRPPRPTRDAETLMTRVFGSIDTGLDRVLAGLNRLVQRQARAILVISAALALVLLGGLSKVSVSSDFARSTGLKIPYIRRMYAVGHSKIGAMDSYNITLTYAAPNAAKDPAVLRKVDALIAEITAFPLVKRVSSLLDVVKDLHRALHEDDPAAYRIPDDGALISQLLLLYEMSGGSEQENWVDYEYRTLRIMVEIAEFDAAEIERQFRVITQRAADLFPDARLGMVGGAVQGAVAQTYIARGEIVSFGIALVVIGLLMMLVFRSVSTGLIGMVPNLAPVITAGGLMGYLDIPLEMTSMMIIPMVLGLAVDDTIHFITHCKVEFHRTGRYASSIARTFHTVGRAIFMTSFILIATFAVYLTSIARFFTNLATIAIAGVLAALLADYLITPILVRWAKPYGPEAPLDPPRPTDAD